MLKLINQRRLTMVTYNKHCRNVYYTDELQDDFAEKTPREELGESYKYIKGKTSRFFSTLFAYLYARPVCQIARLFKGVKVVSGKEYLKELKKKKVGFYVASNSNSQFSRVMDSLLIHPRRTNYVGFSDAWYKKGRRWFLRNLGFLPIPNSENYYKNFEEALDYYVDELHQACVFLPERTYWPYFIGVRPFVEKYFVLPTRHDSPLLPIYYGFRKRTGIYRLFGKTPLLTVAIGKPIYKEEYQSENKANTLMNLTHERMDELARSFDQEKYLTYVKRQPEEDRKKLTILVVCDVYGETNNGTIAVEKDLIRYLKLKGHTVRVLCNDENQKGKEGFFICPKRNFYMFNDYVAKNGVSLSVADMSIIKAAVDGCDAIHVMMPFALGAHAAQYAHSKGIAITAGFHCQSENVLSHVFLKDVQLANTLLYKDFYRKLYRYVDTIHYPSQFIREVFEKVSKLGNGMVISNAIKDGFRKIDGIEKPEEYKDKFVIMYAGRFSKEKRQDFLIKALKYCRNEKHIQIILAGKGPTEAKLRKLAKKAKPTNEIKFVYIPHDELPKTLSYVDLFVSTSQIDIESVSTIEAISCGVTPVFNDSKRSSGRFFALDNRNTFKDRSPKDLARKIDYWYEHEDERKKCSEAYLKLLDRFNYDSCMSEMEEMIYLTVREKRLENNRNKAVR